MHEEKYTRCPECKTIFRVTPQQLAIRNGQVRCGHCQTIFDGNAQMISLAPPANPQENYDESLLARPTITLRSAQSLQPAPEPVAPPTARIAPKEDVEEIAYEERFAWAKRAKRRELPPEFYAVALPLLALLLFAQAIWHFREPIAAHWPPAKPALSRICAAVGCTIQPLRDIAAISIDSSDLQADPAHKGLLILAATLHNRASWPLAYPHLELTLTDAQDQPVVRRALAPSEYAAGTADVAQGIAANGEVPIRLFIDASATSQAGYRLYLFYP